MKRRRSIYKLSTLFTLLIVWGCTPPQGGEERADQPKTGSVDQRGFDPLELPRDREIIPVKYPRSGRIEGSGALIESQTTTNETTDPLVTNLPQPRDTVQNQVFRVQLLTSGVYGEARRAVEVAEEIFDQLVYLDYEVPYYKLRVGDFSTRDEAEQYQQKARAAGYGSGWVVVVNVDVKQAAPLYDERFEIQSGDSVQAEDFQAGDEQ